MCLVLNTEKKIQYNKHQYKKAHEKKYNPHHKKSTKQKSYNLAYYNKSFYPLLHYIPLRLLCLLAFILYLLTIHQRANQTRAPLLCYICAPFIMRPYIIAALLCLLLLLKPFNNALLYKSAAAALLESFLNRGKCLLESCILKFFRFLDKMLYY